MRAVERVWVGLDDSRRRQLPIQDPARVGFGDIEPTVVGGKRDSVGRRTLWNRLHNLISVGLCVIDSGDVAVRGSLLAPIREPEIPCGVKNEIVGTAEPVTIALRVQRGKRVAIEIDPLNRAAGIIRWLSGGHQYC